MDLQSSSQSSSTSSSLLTSTNIWRSDHVVYLSFISEDTCSFVRDLSDALNRRGLNNNGPCKSINPPYPLEKYKIYVVVFSQKYTVSTRYLQELAAMAAKCMNTPGHSFLPIFYKVDPSQVRNSYFLQNIREFELDSLKLIKVQRWLATTVLTQREDLVVRDEEDQRRVIGKVVVEALKILGNENKTVIKDIDQTLKEMDKSGSMSPVGIQSHRVQKLVRLLDLNSTNDVVRFIGICGMGGIGKTALVKQVFNKISPLFNDSCFLANVSEYEFFVEKVLLRLTFQEEYVYSMDNICRSLRQRKMLIVLDDVDTSEKLKSFARSKDGFGRGSRIIIISRDQNILKMLEVDEIHKVDLLNMKEALQLFRETAFGCDYPMKGYEKVTFEALKFAGGLPLVIKSLGSLLRGQSVSEWHTALNELQKVIEPSIFMVLRKSFDGLHQLQKEIFLDIACFFRGEKIESVKGILYSTYEMSYVDETITVLTDKSLITISDQRIEVHFMLQQMGKEIVRQESTELEKRSRIWCYEDFCQVMESNGATHTQAIVMLNEEYPKGNPLKAESLWKMSNLRLLIFHNIKFSGNLYFLSNSLRYLSWHKYPFTCLPSNFEPHQLVELVMSDSSITQLWSCEKMWLPNLRRLNLSGSKYLKKLPHFGLLTNLERFNFEGCTSLSQLGSSIVLLPRLKHLNLRNCTGLISIPNELFDQTFHEFRWPRKKASLEFLNLAGCSQFATCLNFN